MKSGTIVEFLILLILYIESTELLELSTCTSELGMESGLIQDSALSSSSAYDVGSVGPQHGRLRNNKNGGAWCPKQMVSNDGMEYIEINLNRLNVISGVRTQGRFGNGHGQEYAEFYMIEYWRFGLPTWKRWKSRKKNELLSGNSNTFSIVDQLLDPPVIASKVRIIPYSNHIRTICMRVELIGCQWTDHLLSYSSVQGLKQGFEINLSDKTYDGNEKNGYLFHGLGQLVDGQKGQDNFKLNFFGYGKGYEWVGWRNDTPGRAGQPLEILFEFDKVLNFSAIHLHTNNLFTKEIQVFSQARAYFSVSEDEFNKEPVHFSYMPDLVLEHARNVTIKLHHRVGRFLKLQLYFSTRWILISEISFHFVPLRVQDESQDVRIGNVTEYYENFLSFETEKEYIFKIDVTKNISNKPSFNEFEISTESIANDDSKQYIGFVIGVLSVVILILLTAILFIVFHNHKLKTSTQTCDIENRFSSNIQQHRKEDIDKITTEQLLSESTSFYNKKISPLYEEIPDIVCRGQSYQKDLENFNLDLSTNLDGVSPVLLSYLSIPPPVPPPPEAYKTISSLDESDLKVFREHVTSTAFQLDNYQNYNICIEIDKFPRDQLQIVENIGSGKFGELHISKVQWKFTTLLNCDCRLVIVETLKSLSYQAEFEKELQSLAKLKDKNIAQLLGTCFECEPYLSVKEYSEFGDLCQYLQNHVAESASPLTTVAVSLSYGCLIYMATQIASGMKYLESVKYIHKDLATRNCLVGEKYTIKVSNFGSGRTYYQNDYFVMSLSELLPIRWMAWESLLLGKYTSKSDVWSFAVTLWEILTFAREQPYEDLSDEGVIENVSHFYKDNGHQTLLNFPINCPKEIYDIMCECWKRNESDRPTFHEIHLFLQRKNLGYNPDLN